MAASEAPTARTYGNWRRPQRAGLSKLGGLGTAWLFASLVMVMLTWMFLGFLMTLPALLVAFVGLAGFWFRDGDGRSLGQRAATRVGWWRTRSAGSHLYRSGPIGRARWGTCQLPGILGQSQLSESTDSFGRPFAMLTMPRTNTHAVMIRAEPEGGSLVDHHDLDTWISGYAQWLGMVGEESGLLAAQVSIEAAPDSGAGLRREVLGNIDPEAPELAQQVMHQVAATYPAASAQVSCTAALTFTGRPPGGRARPVEEMHADLGSRLPALVEQFAKSGVTAVRPVSAQRLSEMTRTAYDPHAARIVDEAYESGEVPDLDWFDVGPSASEAYWDYYRHDGAYSITWEMTVPPRGIVKGTILKRLLEPHPAIDRKRITLLYRSYDPGVASELVESDLRNAEFNMSKTQRPSARVKAEQKAASRTSEEEATGAGLVDFGLLLTATVTDRERIPAALAAINSLRGSSRLRLRKVHGSQDSAFAAALPLGMVVPMHLTIPTAIREGA